MTLPDHNPSLGTLLLQARVRWKVGLRWILRPGGHLGTALSLGAIGEFLGVANERRGGNQSGNQTKAPSASFASLRDYDKEEAELGNHHQLPYSRLV